VLELSWFTDSTISSKVNIDSGISVINELHLIIDIFTVSTELDINFSHKERVWFTLFIFNDFQPFSIILSIDIRIDFSLFFLVADFFDSALSHVFKGLFNKSLRIFLVIDFFVRPICFNHD